MELTNFLEKNQRLQFQIQAVISKITSYRFIFFEKYKKSKIFWLKQFIFWVPSLQPMGSVRI
jgi:hypothetical protein